MDSKEIFKNYQDLLDKEVTIEGWIRNNRNQKSFGFIDFYDGTAFNTLQIVYEESLSNFEEVSKYLVGSAIKVKGSVVKSSGKQEFEIKAEEVELLGSCSEDYPIQPKPHSREFLREMAYLRPRTNLFQAVFRIRSITAEAIHNYFQERNFIYLHAPIITAADAEGAGEMFQVTTLNLDKIKERFVEE